MAAATLEDVDRRSTSLEKAQGETAESLRWTVAKLGRIQAVQDEHTLRLERLETVQQDHTLRLERLETVQQDHTLRLARLEHKLDGLIEALPGIVAEAVRSSR
jgi:hypothetical protein